MIGFKVSVAFIINETSLEEALENKDVELKNKAAQIKGLEEELNKSKANLKRAKLALNVKGSRRQQGKKTDSLFSLPNETK